MKKVQVQQVMHSAKENAWSIVFIMEKRKVGIVVPVDEVDAKSFIEELDLKEIKDRSGSIWTTPFRHGS